MLLQILLDRAIILACVGDGVGHDVWRGSQERIDLLLIVALALLLWQIQASIASRGTVAIDGVGDLVVMHNLFIGGPENRQEQHGDQSGPVLSYRAIMMMRGGISLS